MCAVSLFCFSWRLGEVREIHAQDVSATVARLCEEANVYLGQDVLEALQKARDSEPSPVGRAVLEQIIENARVAREEQMPLCQDTGLAVLFVELGQDAHVAGGDLRAAIIEGVRLGYERGYLRKSVVSRPFSARTNTRDNTPPVIHFDVVPGDRLKIALVPKGGGSENMSALRMLVPADGRRGLVDFVVETVDRAGANPCPPVIVGVGIGGTVEQTTLLAKRALLRPVGSPSPDPEAAELEAEILARVNDLGIGPAGLGGRWTALAVHVEARPCHITSLPVAANLQCHSARHQEATL
jgi:fumarate hydratase subunit alpha